MQLALILFLSNMVMGLCSTTASNRTRLAPPGCPDFGTLTSWDSCRPRYSSNTTWDDSAGNYTLNSSATNSTCDSDVNNTTETASISEQTDILPVVLFEQDCCYENIQQICTCRKWDEWCRSRYSTCCGPVRECAEQCVCIPDELICGKSKYDRVCSDPYAGQPSMETEIMARQTSHEQSRVFQCPDCST
ncbi:hypothetical protein CFIMG_006503RAa [Ceratocystis fimbriata CBS 114723]|uniref:Uncharacterized protein n=1 Tax=Ceratocystis fimbriata CBS 114723 TaxID=1035309 RepID=A0A2C5WUH2_9PEZI|nr:hypothetical protein CFIMG_006503RAa [Ceratocystis fimbriata CBS 114723]